MTTMVPYKNNYALGRGMAFLSSFIAGTETPDGNYRYLGNSPSISVNIAGTQLDHYSSDGGINELDESILTQVTRTATLSVDNINMANLALMLMGSTATVAQAADATAQTEIFKAVTAGTLLVPGVTASNPTGLTGAVITAVVSGSVTGVKGTDYALADGLPGVFVTEGSKLIGLDVSVTYTVPEASFEQVISGNTPFEGALRYVEDNPAGNNKSMFMPKVRVTPNGDFALKGDTWQAIPFTVSILNPGSGSALYINGQPQNK